MMMQYTCQLRNNFRISLAKDVARAIVYSENNENFPISEASKGIMNVSPNGLTPAKGSREDVSGPPVMEESGDDYSFTDDTTTKRFNHNHLLVVRPV